MASAALVRGLLFVAWFASLDADVYHDRPRIKTSEGHLILEPASDKNIYLQTNGPQSTIFVGGVNLLNINITNRSEQSGPSNIDLEQYFNNGPESILRRLERLERRQNALPSDVSSNVTLLWRRVNRLTSRINTLQDLIDNFGRDECQSRPCLHGGTCLNLASGYQCLCPRNWEGKDCDQDVNECVRYQGTDLGCQNGANCKNTPGSYECECTQGWYGQHCTRRSKDCSGGNFEMCGHGTCVTTSSGEGINCICDQGWTNNNNQPSAPCLQDIDECKPGQGARCSVNPRVRCINLPGSFHCERCPSGYDGDGYTCYDIDECLTSNGGCSTSPIVTCHNTVGSRICGPCPVGYQGDGVTCTWRGSCSINHGGCHPSAQCVDNSMLGGQMAQCICPQGMEGDGIGLHGCYVASANTQSCDVNPCGIHGQCHLLRTGYTCICYRGYSGAQCDAPRDYCSSNPCLNGGRCKADLSSPRGFRCECTAQYSGNLCQEASTTCGGYLQAEEGSIVYPLTNSTYHHNIRCAWVIHTESDKVINVTFSKFNLEAQTECLYDFLQIHDGRSSANQLIGRFCGTMPPKGGNIISSNNNLYLWFRSDQTVAREGFALHWNSINPVCGGEVNAKSHGQISTPGSPGKYPPNRDCYWNLSTDLGKRIQLHFFTLDIEAHPNCSYDFVAIYDGEHTTDPLLGQYCNSTQPAPVTSLGSDMLVHFHSDGYNSGYGFQATFSPAEGTPGCGGLFTTNKGEISSPSYDGKYLSNVICEYKIKVKIDNRIRINFKSFSLERSLQCKYDYLKIYDGSSENSPLVGKFCGNTYPKSYTSSANELYIVFKSDHSAEAEGFRISYDTVCQKTVIGDSGFIKSPGYPYSYPKDSVCEYVIGTAPGKAIQLTFQDFDIEEDGSSDDCLYDNVEIRDGANINATLLGRYCGDIAHAPPSSISTHNYLYLRLNSDLSNTGTGFYANFTTIDIECGGIYKENKGTINHPSENQTYYSNNQRCMWIILAPEGMHIKLTWNRFGLESGWRSCQSDFVKLEEIDENNDKNSLGIYCGHTLPPAITPTTNQLQITFKSDFSIRDEGFSVSYSFLDEKTHCGGTYTKTHGFIYSPGWPKRYPTHRDCVWTIIAPAGQQIMLNITQFDIEEALRADSCVYGDYLDIRNGLSETSAQLGKFCGRFQSKRITSHSNTLYLHFHSDFLITGKGFKIEWDSTIIGCGGTLSSPSGSISSPNYPLNYNGNAECFYHIVTNAGSKVQITFNEFELEITRDCIADYVELFDGRDENSQSLGKFCKGSNLKNIESITNEVYIKFRSDMYASGKGFLLEYNTLCQNNLTGLYGVIESPGYPNSYSSYWNCLWTINVPKGNSINITFTNFDVGREFRPSSTRTTICHIAYIQIKEPTDINNNNKVCGTTLPDKVSSKGNSLQIKFISSPFYIPFQGFRLEWVRYGCGGYIRKNSGYITIDSSLTSRGELECEWVIETSQGSRIKISIKALYMFTSKNCTTDAIEFYNGPNTMVPFLTKICQRDTGETFSVISTTNYMLVRFVKKSSLKDVNFSLFFSSDNFGCGSRIESLSGMIHSKNYPKNYDNNMDCMWTLVVPVNNRIALSFIEFDLYSSSDKDFVDCEDFINIYERESIFNSNYTTRLCPKTNVTSSPIISKTNTLGVQFITNKMNTAKGFKANFTVICGATVTAKTDGIISINSFRTSHILNNCTWIIVAPTPEKKISLTITHMFIPKDTDIITNRHCPSSFLRVLEGDDDEAPLVDEYCGRKVPPMIVSQGSALTLIFGAYNGTALGQFSIHYALMTSTCGGTFTSEEGSIASPNYPLSYAGNASCEWILNTSPGNKVYITFEQFDLQWSENCNEDYLEVRENDGAGKLLGLHCGSEIPTNTTAASKLYLKFHSNSENNGKGFLLHYGFLHGNEINNLPSGVIASPLYPNYYHGTGEYYWRISVDTGKVISIIVDNAEIPAQGSVCFNSLTFYDGYDEEALVLEEFCGILKASKEITTSSNIAFIKLKLEESITGSIFHLIWTNSDTAIESNDVKPNCGSNKTEIVLPGQKIIFNSPGYPEDYENYLNCEWIYRAEPGRHLNLHFLDLELEETPDCDADHVSVFSSDSLTSWKLVKDKICLSNDAKYDLNSSNYMKIVFNSDYMLARKGFLAKVSSICGGFINNLSGIVEPIYQDISSRLTPWHNCDWKIKVRPGRVIKLHFDHFNITNTNNDCSTNVVIRNGDSKEAPLLRNSKFCGKVGEDRSDLESSSNVVYVTYTTTNQITGKFTNFRLHYEEKGVECGFTSLLDADHNWEVFNSINYPNQPTPYSECIWVFRGPRGESLKIDFIDRFDLDSRNDCSLEYVEIKDGSTDISPVLSRLCGNRQPSSIKTNSDSVFIKYYTQSSDPNNGFKANVSIDICGGTIVASRGEVISPGYPRLRAILHGSVCEWHIIGPRGFTLLLQPKDLNLPQSRSYCGTKITIEEKDSVNNNITILQKYCDQDTLFKKSFPPIQTSSNEVTIKLQVARTSDWSPAETNAGFKFSFNSSWPSCGGDITTPEGFITTPGYPRETTLRFCTWRITIPNKTRRIRLELLDYDSGKAILSIIDGLRYSTLLKMISNESSAGATNVFESSQNSMTVSLWSVSRSVKSHKFKAKFSSNEAALCGGILSTLRGELNSPNLNRSYTCTWRYKSTDITFQSLYVTVKLNSSSPGSYCSSSDSNLIITSVSMNVFGFFMKHLCGNIDTSFVIPSNEIDFIASKSQDSSLFFHIEWQLNKCGGIIHASENKINILNVPDNNNETLNCVWVIYVPSDTRAQIELNGFFQSGCDNEYIKLIHGLELNDQLAVLGDYCKEKVQTSPLEINYRFVRVQYHSDIKSNTSIQLTVQTISDPCGGILSDYQNIFESPHFPHHYDPNIECSWEINTDEGNRISLKFIERFAIELNVNCSKDAVILYDWKDNTWVQAKRLCGRNLPPVFNSTYNRMKVVFQTDADIQLDGFKAQWEPICGGRYYATNKVQYLHSPGTKYAYEPNVHCTYEILSGGSRISIKFLEFELEGTYPSCSYDNLTISGYDKYFEGTTYCDSEKPPDSNKYTRVTFTFKTDEYIQYEGFKLSYQLYTCGGLIKHPSSISSHFGNNEYDYNENCTWIIEAPQNKIVVVEFQYIEIEPRYNCFADSLAVFDSNWNDENQRLALLCGNLNTPTILRSTDNNMVIQFLTDDSFQGKGFTADIFFSYSSSAGCGGEIDLTRLSPSASQIFSSPLINGSKVYENFLDCHWNMKSSTEYRIKIKFIQFHIAPCDGINQTAVGFSKCDCDYVQILDGINPNDLVIGTYCGHDIPEGQELTSSSNFMSVRLVTDGEIASAGFKAELSLQRHICGQTMYTVGHSIQTIKSPGYETGSISRGVRCVYHFDASSEYTLHITIKNLDVRFGQPNPNECNKDKLLIISVPEIKNSSIGKNFIIDTTVSDFFSSDRYTFYEENLRNIDRLEYCGKKSNIDLYLKGSVSIHLITSPDSDLEQYKGVQLEVSYAGFCGRNFTELHGRISSQNNKNPSNDTDCYTLITVPENYTISLYFLSIRYPSWNEDVNIYLDIFDGDKNSSPKLERIQTDHDDKQVFSNGRHLLLHNHFTHDEYVTYDLNYMATDKGRGCGGKLHDFLGKVTSPLHPNVYRQRATCEWELETPQNTRLLLRFTIFDLGSNCATNYVQLVDRSGKIISTYCDESPADYTSTDNYVKIVFVTTMNNGGSGWIADFIAVL